MEKIGYILLLIVAVCWLIAMLVGMITIFTIPEIYVFYKSLCAIFKQIIPR
ncbi:hypothetical protein ES703_70494 [subsurface metagenome]